MCGIVDKGPCGTVFLWVEFSLCEDCSGLRARLRLLYPEKRIVIRGLRSPVDIESGKNDLTISKLKELHARSFINHQKSSVVQACSERAIRHTILPSF